MSLLGKQQLAAINKMKDENEALKQRLARESRFSRLSKDMSTSGDIVKLQNEANSYLRRIEQERKKISDLDQEIASAQETMIEQKRKMGGINASKENSDMISRQIRLFENRLDKALVKFNESLAKNKSLRLKIDNLRRERVVFDGIYKKLERELHEKKKEMAAIIEDSKNAYQVRDKSSSEMQALRQQAKRDQEEFDREWERLGKIMEEDRQLRESMAQVVKEGSGPMREGGPAGGAAGSMGDSNSPFLQNATALGFAGPGGDPGLEDGMGATSLSYERVAAFEEAFQKVKEQTKIKDVNELVDKFLQAEDKNFRLFNFVNSLNSDIGRLELQIADTKAEIETFKGQGNYSDTQHKKVLRELEEKLSRTESKADEYDAKYNNATKTIQLLKTGIQSIFTRLGPSRRADANGSSQALEERASVEEMLGNQGVTESNMMQYLGIIEQRTSEILQMYYQSQAASTGMEPPSQSFIQEGLLQAGNPRLTVMPPAWEDFSSGEESDQEDDERPLTRDELQRKTLRGMGKKERKKPFKSYGSKIGGPEKK